MLSTEQRARVKWACRRGMLELDVIIMPFFEHCFDELSQTEQQDFIELLNFDDPQLFVWLMGKGSCEKANLAAMVNQIATYNHNQQRSL